MRFLAAVVLLGGLGAAYSAEPLPKHGTLRDPWDPTGIDGTCRFQYIPGVEGAAIPPPQPCPGAVIRVFWPKEEKPVAEAKADETGRFRIKLEPGTYRVEVVPPQMSWHGGSLPEVKVERGKSVGLELIVFELAP
ncbi:MAG TPA: carboxypeptidase-like regulatory domain-containing protein [Gemmataceae bacterium]|nr:carboxypeptidase-like regulatory domain-containing protein [Gemmataceae bacterium]